MSRRRQRNGGAISADEARLWQTYTKGLEPLKKREARQSGVLGGDGAESADMQALLNEADAHARNVRPAASKEIGQNRSTQHRPKKATSEPVSGGAASIDRRQARRLQRGRTEIEAVLDLHGMRQAEAYLALRGFLLNAQRRGFRYVKVITGKGGRGSQSYRMDDLSPGGEDRGVLRRVVPDWLTEGELAQYVVAISTAGRGHGGEGALYVQVRRAK